MIRTFHRQGRCSRGGHLCNEHSEEKYSCSYKKNSTTDILIRFCVNILYECILILMGLGERLWLFLRQLKGFEARISLFKSLDCPLTLAAAGRNQRFTRYPPVINHNQGWCNYKDNMVIRQSHLYYGNSCCPACRTYEIATRFWVVVICPIIKCLTVL